MDSSDSVKIEYRAIAREIEVLAGVAAGLRETCRRHPVKAPNVRATFSLL